MNGIILIDKPQGITSRDVVNKISKILGTKKVGHTGTLDPIATGILVLCIGKATKISELITNYDKEYIAEITLGIETDTLDTEGHIIREVKDISVTKEQIVDVLNSFKGKIKQQVPIYSAIKVKGKKLYEYARNNKEVELPTRDIEIYNIELISDVIDNRFKIKCHVSKGTYIRSLVRDIGLKLGYPACMSSLRRIKQGSFSIDECHTIKDVEANKYKLIQIDKALFNIKTMVVDTELEKKIRDGAIIDKRFEENLVKMINKQGEVIAIYQTYDKDITKAKPYKMLI